jgi:hypothetical protein
VSSGQGKGDRAASPPLCARCGRAARDQDDRAAWVTIDDDEICLGCMTLSDRERLRADEDR